MALLPVTFSSGPTAVRGLTAVGRLISQRLDCGPAELAVELPLIGHSNAAGPRQKLYALILVLKR